MTGASLATVLAVGGGLALAGAPTAVLASSAAATTSEVTAMSLGQTRQVVQRLVSQREQALSRSASRLTATLPSTGADALRLSDPKFATTSLNIRVAPAADARVIDTVDYRTQLIATGVVEGGYAEVLYDHEHRWVSAGYLSDTRPAKASAPATQGASAGLSDAPCPTGSAVESGLTPGAIRVHRAVCHAFPQITTYLGYRPDGEHANGKAVDVMTSDPTLGYAIASFLQAHAAELNLYDIIYRQHIWTPVRASEGWRLMPDRGSITANHYDHVHVAVN